MKRRDFVKAAGLASMSGAMLSTIPTAKAAVEVTSPVRAEGRRTDARAASTDNIVFPSDALAVVDVTKAPYHCDNSGERDCTAALIRALDDLVRPTLLAQRALEEEMARDPRASYTHPLSMENRKIEGKVMVIFPVRPSPSKVLYFPNGTYKVSDTLCYTFNDLHNSQHNELNRQIIVRGQSEAGTVIRLKDHCAGFEAGAGKPVFSFIRKNGSNVAMANLFENITINTGVGNPGAAGLRFFSNNMGAVRHVSIVSGDPGRIGHAGILCDHSNFSGSYFRHVTVDGFDYGVQVLPHKMYSVFEHITLRNQRTAGFLVDENPVAIRGLRSVNRVPALLLTGSAGHVVLLDSDLGGAGEPAAAKGSAIEHRHGVLFARNVAISGYRAAVGRFGREVLPPAPIAEYSSHGVFALFPGQVRKSLNLPAEETPEPRWEQDMAEWVNVNSFGARGDGRTDDTAAIQRALHSGRRVVYFQPGRYLIDGQIRVPATVERINFMFCDLVAGAKLRAMSGQGTFKVDEDAKTPLIIEDLFAFEEYRGEQYFVEHASRRTVVLSDLHVQVGAMYTNSVTGGSVFIENVLTTDQFAPDPNCHRFRGQKVWARQLNAERADPAIINDGSQLWVLGFKTESKGVGFDTRNQGATEVMGGVINFGGSEKPFLVNDDSRIAIACATRGGRKPGFTDFAREKSEGREAVFRSDRFPRRIVFPGGEGPREYDSYAEQYFVPLYVGYR